MEIVYLLPYILTTQVDEWSPLNRPMHFIVCIGAGRFEKFHNRTNYMFPVNVLLE